MVSRLQWSLNLKETGCFPQAETAIYPIPTDDPDFSQQLFLRKGDLSKVVFPKPILEKRARLTDLISCGMMGTSFRLLVSEKLKDIIEDSLHREMQFAPANIVYKGEERGGYWFTNHYNMSMDLIDFVNCEIVKSELLHKRRVEKPIFIRSYEEYLEEEKKLKPPVGITIKTLTLKETNREEFFTLDRVKGGIGYFVSDALKKKLIEVGCTGIRFMDINEKL